MEEDVRDLKELLDVFYKEKDTTWITIHTPQIKNIENILNELERLQKENKKLISDNLEYQRIQDIFNERTYRKKYLEERRKEEPNLLYPDADEIYQRYYKLKKENEKLSYIISEIEQYTLDEQINEESINYNEFIEVQNMAFDGVYNKLQELLNKGE